MTMSHSTCLCSLTDVEDSIGRSQHQQAPEACSHFESSGETNDSAFAMVNGLPSQPIRKNQSSVLKVSPVSVPVLLSSTASITTADHSCDTRTLSLIDSNDVSAKDNVIHTEVLTHNISKLPSKANEITLPTSSYLEKEETSSRPKSRSSTSQINSTHDSRIALIGQKSQTFGGLQTRELTSNRSDRRAQDKGTSSVGDKVWMGIQRSRTWLDWRRLKFDLLEDRVKGAVELSMFSHQKNSFLPQGQLLKFVTQSSVEIELSRWKHIPHRSFRTRRVPSGVQVEEQISLAGATPARSQSDNVLPQDWGKTYRKIFAILLFVNRPSSIWSFVEESICDADLPLIKVSRTEGPQHLFDLRRRHDPELPLHCFKQWKDRAIAKFEERQWIVLAPSFEKSDGKVTPHRKFAAEEILPFLSWKATPEEGGFGQVYKVDIHPDHHAFKKTEVPNDVIAVKRLLSKHTDPERNRQAFLKESNILNNLSKEEHTHPHLITLLATFEKQGHYYLMFPWADADLEDYWKMTPNPRNNDASMAKWVIDQCQGIAEALSKIHRYPTQTGTTMLEPASYSDATSKSVQNALGPLELFGRHGDIKPKNILWFRDRTTEGEHGILKVTDFGIARFTKENAPSKRERGIVPNSQTYRSPECDLPYGEIGPQCDVWALGCVYLVFITWFFGGWEHVEEFATMRSATDRYWAGFETDSFFKIVGDQPGVLTAKVKECVTQKIQELQSHSACTEAFCDLLDHIKKEMIIVQKNETRKIGVINRSRSCPALEGLDGSGKERTRRRSSGNIARDLGSILVKCKTVPGYLSPTELLEE